MLSCLLPSLEVHALFDFHTLFLPLGFQKLLIRFQLVLWDFDRCVLVDILERVLSNRLQALRLNIDALKLLAIVECLLANLCDIRPNGCACNLAISRESALPNFCNLELLATNLYCIGDTDFLQALL